MANATFGTGVLFGKTLTGDNIKFATLQEINVEFNGSVKELFGGSKFPLAIGQGSIKVTGSAKSATINSAALAQLFFNETPADGQLLISIDEKLLIPDVVTNGPQLFYIANSAQLIEDMGVTFNGVPLTFIYNADPDQINVGEYGFVVNSEAYVYCFNENQGDLSKIRVTYSYLTTTGKTITMNNQNINTAPSFKAILQNTTEGKTYGLTLNVCKSSKLSMPNKMEDFQIVGFDFAAACDEYGELGSITRPD